jgi:sugar phosphate permease
MNSARPTRVRYGVLAFLAAAAAVAYLDRNGMMVAEKTIRADVHLTEDQMGLLMGAAFFWPYALCQIPMGWLAQRLGPRVWLPFLMLVTSAATALFGIGGGFAALFFSRAISGAAQAGLFPGCTQTIGRWYPATERGIATGVLSAFMSVGGATGALLTGWLLEPVGWQMLCMWYALPGLLWAIGFSYFFRNSPAEHPATNEAERKLIAADRPAPAPADARQPGGVWLALALSPALWLICGQQFFRAAAYAFFQSWFPTYLAETRGVSITQAGNLTVLPLLGFIFGMLSGGRASDLVYRRTGSLFLARKVLSMSAVIASGLAVASAFFVDDPTIAVLTISWGAFLAGLAGPLAYAITIDMGGRNVATVFATMNMAGNVGAGLLPWVVPSFRRAVEADPWLLELADGNGWNAVLLLFAAMYFASAACWLLLRVRGTVLDQSLIRPREDADEIAR